MQIDSKIEYIKIIVPDFGNEYISAKYQKGSRTTSVEIESDNKIYVKTPRDVIFCCITNKALYYAETTLLNIEHFDYTSTFIVETPQDFKEQQKRKHYRVKVDSAVRLTYQDGGFEKTISCKTSDISAGGIRLILNERPHLPLAVKMDIVFENRTIEAKAKLIRCYYNNNIPQAAFEFVDISQDDLEYITDICYKKQIQGMHIRKNIHGR